MSRVKAATKARKGLGFVFGCERTLIKGRQVRSKINQTVDANVKNKNIIFHTLIQRGKWWAPDLWLVGSRAKGIPFAEAVLAKFGTRPLLAAAKSGSREGNKLHIVTCRVGKGGKEEIEEYELPLKSDDHALSVIESFSREIVSNKGKVVLLAESFDSNLVLSEKDGSLKLSSSQPKENDICYSIEWFDRHSANQRLATEKGKIAKIPTSPMAKALTGCVIGFIGLMVLTRSEQQAEETAIKKSEQSRTQFANEFYKGYSPRVAMYQLYSTMVKKVSDRRETGLRSGVAGWKPTKIQLTPKAIMVNMKTSSNSPANHAREAAHRIGAGIVSVAQNEILIVKEFDPNCSIPVLKQPTLIPIEGTINFVMGGLEKFIPNAKVTFGKEKKKGEYAVRDIDIDVKNMSEEGVDLLGVLLNDLPIGFKQGNFKVDGNFGLLSGKIQLQVIGCSLDNVTSAGLCK
ncbi:TPA: hypothetical protein JG825_003430 [Vibrio parahaemolyticus]|nr:hypothetical protein [Vibrio parahaemolyticus]UPR19008.1 hypothetical protein H9J99_26030 [Vibrio parahaemolyticus]HAV1520111.1 hypothetical protein [Vibrio parahaemolyticus]HAV1539078.1 hypothetical protein [Vibrio parahaemolyticus]